MARLGGHARDKYTTGTLLGTSAGLGWDGVLAERWRNSAGDLGEVEVRDTEVIVMIDGALPIRRRGDGRLEQCHAVPGTVWLCPDGVREDMIRLDGEVRESLHLFLPAAPLSAAALGELGVDPGRAALRYVGGFRDPLIEHIARAIRAEMLDPAPAGKMAVETLAAALGVHLLRHRSSLNPAAVPLPAARGALDPTRLRRIEDFIEAHPAEDLTIGRLASEARLSPFHFARAFRAATGAAPHRYVADRRMQRARAMPADGVALTAERDGNVLWVALSGRLDAASARGFARALGDAVAGTDRAVVLDCGRLRFIGSVGIRALLAAAKSLERQGGRLVLCAPSEPVRRVLRITGFDRFLPIHETREAARAALGG